MSTPKYSTHPKLFLFTPPRDIYEVAVAAARAAGIPPKSKKFPAFINEWIAEKVYRGMWAEIRSEREVR
jgi:hypothetical protein